MPSKTRSSSRLRSSAVKKIQKRVRGKQTRKHVTKLRASRKIQTNYRGFKTRKVMNRVRTNMLTDNNCSICLEPLTINVAIALPCGHRFHKDCIVNWLVRSQGKCPNCKQRITNIPYISIVEPELEPEPEYEPLILDPILRRQYILERMHEIELWEREIEELRPQVPDPPEIPDIPFNDALSNQYSANQTEYYVRRLYNEASYNYNNYRSLNINDETLEQDVSNMFFITSELLTRARDNSRNANRICSHIADIEFAEYM
uniref:RING-type E3 ubiquitin transferase n=1 Tax=viral metagenome TaxID=1070528 RepID=A0A6C0DWQ0_9ZZZZ